MNRTIEIESRYKIIGDIPKLAFSFSKKEKIVDIYLDTKDGNMYQQGVFIRNRNNSKLDFKFNLESLLDKSMLNDHGHCDEYSFSIPFTPSIKKDLKNVCEILKLNLSHVLSFEEFIKANSLQSLVIVDKDRYEAKDSGFNLCLDIVKGVGNFIEIEKMLSVDGAGNDHQKVLNEAKQSIKSYVDSLKISVKQLETGYVELVLKESNYDLYKKGLYLLKKNG